MTLVSSSERVNGMISLSYVKSSKIDRYKDPFEVVKEKEKPAVSGGTLFIYQAVKADKTIEGSIKDISVMVGKHFEMIRKEVVTKGYCEAKGYTVTRKPASERKIKSAWDGANYYKNITVRKYCELADITTSTFYKIKTKRTICLHRDKIFSMDHDIKSIKYKPYLKNMAFDNDRFYFGTIPTICNTLGIDKKQAEQISIKLRTMDTLKLGEVTFRRRMK
ncbi:MAG: hypothetical protein GY777_13805 [Candidatus Brocadiaceae bacterium]|nr:hypothetical protein [Candidatus Brocadiaceae bacterium]